MIEAGRVRVNGNTARLGEQADAEEDVIELDGVRLRTRQEPELVYRMLCKPRGFVTTMHFQCASIPSDAWTAILRGCCF